MGETMSANSLLLMLVAALVYPTALKALLPPERRGQVALWKLWAVTLAFACGSWFLALFWAQELHPETVSMAAIACLTLALPIVYRLCCATERPTLGWLLLAQIGVLAYAAGCWAIMSLSAAATRRDRRKPDARVGVPAARTDPDLGAASTAAGAKGRPVRRPERAASLCCRFLGNPHAFWGIFPPLPSQLEPLLGGLAWLVVLGVLAWIAARLLRTPLGPAASHVVSGVATGFRRLPGAVLRTVTNEWSDILTEFGPRGNYREGLSRLPAVLSANCRAILSGAWRWLVSFVGASGFALLALARAMQRGAHAIFVAAPKSGAHMLARSTAPWALDSLSWRWQPGMQSWSPAGAPGGELCGL